MKHYLLFIVPLFIVLSGCQKGSTLDTNLIDGSITLDGASLAKANITFCPVSGGEIASAYSDEYGKFTVSSQNGAAGKGALTGEYAVTVSKVDAKWIPAANSKDPEAGETVAKELLPAVYLDKKKTPLKVNIVKGKNSVVLEVKSKP